MTISRAPILKRMCDLLVATLFLVVAAPLLALLMALIRLDSRGPVFFRQQRLGLNGGTFRIWKLRTMVVDAETRGAGKMTYESDPRITRVGRVLRRYRLDEFPQLINVLFGDMSIVGPRPLLPEHLHAYSVSDRRRLSVRPGITGWQQVNGGSRLNWEERVALDIWYADHWSIWLDFEIMWRTVAVMVKADTAYGVDGWQTSGIPTGLLEQERKKGQLDS